MMRDKTRSAAALLPLLIEMNDLKRIRVADRVGSIATHIFRRSWAALVSGEDLQTVADRETAHAVAAARLAGIDARVMQTAGLGENAIRDVFVRGFDAVADPIPATTRDRLRSALTPAIAVDPAPDALDLPPFVDLLVNQPRAGATRPGHARVVLEPAEHHGDHCGSVAVYAAILAALFDADPALPFLCGLAHHLHNARLPDAGFAGDELLGPHLQPLMSAFRDQAIAELPQPLHAPVRAALDLVYRADSLEARAFQAADVLDRVLEMRWHAQSAAFTLDVALGEMDIVHPGPVQAFQLDVMRDAGLM
jgi:hypothetical protein